MREIEILIIIELTYILRDIKDARNEDIELFS